MPGGSAAAAAAAEALDRLMAKAEECRAAALKYAMAPFRMGAQKGEESAGMSARGGHGVKLTPPVAGG